MPTRKKADEINFESALDELEKLVSTMEKGELSLEQSLQQFERGVTLTKQCQKALQEAEQKVEILTKDNALEPFNEDDE